MPVDSTHEKRRTTDASQQMEFADEVGETSELANEKSLYDNILAEDNVYNETSYPTKSIELSSAGSPEKELAVDIDQLLKKQRSATATVQPQEIDTESACFFTLKDYKLTHYIGEGAFGQVFLCKGLNNNTYAVKV